jgi:PilZ domain
MNCTVEKDAPRYIMVRTPFRCVVDTVLRRAQRQGYVVPRDVREELTRAGMPELEWKDILHAARESLHYRQGRYYFIEVISPRLYEQQSQQQIVFHAIRQLIRKHQASTAETERRHQDRLDFIHPALVKTADNQEFRFLSRDLSPTGIRLLGNRSLLGQRVQVQLAPAHGAKPFTFLVRILWSCAVGDGLFENGGGFLGMTES